jgi:hypothetical protein
VAINTSPVFTKAPELGPVSVATANANLDGTGTVETIYTAGSDGAFVHRVWAKAIVTTTAGMLRFYLYDGSAYFLLHEEPIPAITKSATVPAWEGVWECRLRLEASHSLRVSTEKAETFKVVAEAESLTS